MTPIKCIQTGFLGVNTYIVPCDTNSLSQGNRVYVVDPGGEANFISDEIKKMGAELVGIVLTHGHFDHVGALAGLKELHPNALVCIHEGDIDCIGKKGYDTHKRLFQKLNFDGADFFSHNAMPEADVILMEGLNLPFASDWKILHTAGHTKGSCCLYNEKEKVLLSGDTLFFRSYGRTDLPGGSFAEIKQSLQMLFQLPENVVVYPGHEKLTTIGQEKNMSL